MADHSSRNVIANRDEPIPVINLPDASGLSAPSDQPQTPDRKSSSAQDKLRSLHASASSKVKDKLASFNESKGESPKGIQDRMMELYVCTPVIGHIICKSLEDLSIQTCRKLHRH